MIIATGVIGGAAFPEVMGQATSSQDSVGGSMMVTLPSGVMSGELLLIFSNFNDSSISGWARVFESSLLSVFWKIATGSEGASVSIVKASGTDNGGAVAYRIKGATTAEAASPASGSSTSPNPGSLSPSWGKKSTLWFAAMGAQRVGSGGGVGVTGAPSGFSNYQSAIGISSFPLGQRVSVVERQERIATMDPGSYTLDSSLSWSAATIGTR